MSKDDCTRLSATLGYARRVILSEVDDSDPEFRALEALLESVEILADEAIRKAKGDAA